MSKIVIQVWMILLLAMMSFDSLVAQTSATLVKSELVFTSSKQIFNTDLVRFKNDWIMVCCEGESSDRPEGILRVITSRDGRPWESLATIVSPTVGRLLSQPGLVVKPNGQLMLTAVGIVPSPQETVPLPEYGGTLQTLVWYSVDGRTWSQATAFGKENYLQGKSAWHNDLSYSYSRGFICGNAQTIEIVSSNEGQGLKPICEHTISNFFPHNAALVFVGELGACLMSRIGERGTLEPGLLGTSKFPFKQWEWKETDTGFCYPNAIQIDDKRVFVSIGVSLPKRRKLLCQLDLDSGKLTELLEVPEIDAHSQTGMIFDDGHLWMSFHGDHQFKSCAYLAQILIR